MDFLASKMSFPPHNCCSGDVIGVVAPLENDPQSPREAGIHPPVTIFQAPVGSQGSHSWV